MVSLKSIHPQTRQLRFTIPCYKIQLTGLWVNWLSRNHLIDTLCEMKVRCRGGVVHCGPVGTRIPTSHLKCFEKDDVLCREKSEVNYVPLFRKIWYTLQRKVWTEPFTPVSRKRMYYAEKSLKWSMYPYFEDDGWPCRVRSQTLLCWGNHHSRLYSAGAIIIHLLVNWREVATFSHRKRL